MKFIFLAGKNLLSVIGALFAAVCGGRGRGVPRVKKDFLICGRFSPFNETEQHNIKSLRAFFIVLKERLGVI